MSNEEKLVGMVMTATFALCAVVGGYTLKKSLEDQDNLVKRGDNTPPINVSVKPEVKIDNKKAAIIYCDDNLNPKYVLSPEKEAPVLVDEYKNAGEPLIWASEPLLYRGNIANAFTPTNPQETSTQWYLKKSDGSVITLTGEEVKESRQAFLKVTMDNSKTAMLLNRRANNSR